MEVTVNVPAVGQESVFTFKEPFNTYIKNKYNFDSLTKKIRVISVISMRDMIRNDLRDPFTEIYSPAGLSEIDYKQDIVDSISIISFSFKDEKEVERYFRVPLNYINSVEKLSSVSYINKLLVIDLNKLPYDLDLSVHFDDIKDFIVTRIGVIPQLKEVSLGNIESVDREEADTRETIRTNLVSVHKTLAIQLEEANLRNNQILNRLQDLHISLG